MISPWGPDLAVVESHLSSVAIQNNVDWNDDAVVTEWLQANIEYVKGEVCPAVALQLLKTRETQKSGHQSTSAVLQKLDAEGK